VFICLSLKINLYVFFLNGRLDDFGIIVVSSRSLSGLNSLSGSMLRLSCHSRLGLISLRLSLEINSLIIVDDFFVVNWLSDIFLSRSINSSSLDVLFGYS